MARAREISQPALKRHWAPWHTASVSIVTAVCLGMAFWFPWGPFAAWIVLMIAMALFILIVGHGVTGAWTGAIIDDRCKMSLSRLQLLLWTIVVVSALAVIATVRMRQDAATALDIGVPATLWTLLAITSTSLVGSPVIKSTQKASGAPEPSRLHTYFALQGKTTDEVDWQGPVVTNASIAQASPADLFTGEYVNNFTLLDVGKIQLFLFTVLLLLQYCLSIGHVLSHEPYPASLPDIGAGVLPLFGVSHAGYLMNKVVTSPLMSRPDAGEGANHG
jgi:hypothetical protein